MMYHRMKIHSSSFSQFFKTLTVLSLFLPCLFADEGVEVESDEAFLNRFISQTGYKKENRPPLRNNSFSVSVSVKYFGIKMLNEPQDKINLDIDLIHTWHDPRLVLSNNGKNNLNIKLPKMTKNQEKPIWLPNTHFHVFQNNSINDEFLDISKTGEITLTTELDVNVSCQLDYNLFPVDQQNCSVVWSIFNSKHNSFGYKWSSKNSITTSVEKIKFNGYYLNGFRLRTDPVHKSLMVDVLISRQFFFYFIRYYVPSFFVVVISFTPLYMTHNSHSKVNLGVAVMLGMVMLLNGNYSQLPKVNYLTLLDVYLFFCFFSVFLSVVEYALIGYFDLVVEKSSDKIKEENGIDKVESEDMLKSKKNLKRHKKAVKVAYIVDYVARKMYPSVFALFHLVYAAVLIAIVVQNRRVEIRHPSLWME